jgi:phosphatidylglycerol:prolipoprotein diacylglycerol transferase
MSAVLFHVHLLAAIGWKVLDRFHFGSSFAISPHGVGIAVGYLAGAYVLLFEAKRRGIPEDKASSMVFWALIGAIVGARLFYVIGHFSEFGGIGDMLAVYKGGISLIGGIFGAVIAGYPIMRKNRLGFLRVMDCAAIGLPLGIVIGRIGDLIIGDHLGKPTSWALAFVYKGGNLSGYQCVAPTHLCQIALSGDHAEIVRPGVAQLFRHGRLVSQGVGVHQTALYDFLATMVLVSIVVWMSRTPRRTGVLFLTFTTWYGMGRLITDFLRIDKTFFGLTGSQWSSLAVVILSVATLVRFALRPTKELPEGEGPSSEDGVALASKPETASEETSTSG